MEQLSEKPRISDIENAVIKFWNKNLIQSKRREQNKDKPIHDFIDGPPFVSGNLHLGHTHIFGLKSIDDNFANMNGKNANLKYGLDVHGLPAEMMVCKELDLKTNQAVRDYGQDNYIKYCQDTINRLSNSWIPVYERVARFVDPNNKYTTMDTNYMESVWWACKELYNKNLLYKGYKIMPYSIACGTPLSNTEANENYKDITDISVYIKFKVLTEENTYFLVWTTTPWTLPTNLALAMNPDMEYAKIKDIKSGDYYIIAKNCVDNIYGKVMLSPKYDIISVKKGIEYTNVEYIPIFNYYPFRNYKVIMAEYVKDGNGTGIVHQSPGHGAEDFDTCIKNKIVDITEVNEYCPIDENGRFVSPVNEYIGLTVFEANPLIIERLEKNGVLVKKQKHIHSYPHCYRTDTKLIYKAVSSWFVKVTEIKGDMLNLNKKVNWVPENVGTARYHNWVSDSVDWGISRNRIFGNPIPIWISDDGEEVLVIGSIDELITEANLNYRPNNLHLNYLSGIEIPSKQGKGMLKLCGDVLDCWFESGCVPFASIHYPFENKTHFDDKEYLSDIVIEAIDQVRGWFYYLNVMSTSLFNKPAFRNVICSGLILAEDGKKISKRHANGSSPMELCNIYGADPLRLYLSGSPAAHSDEVKLDFHAIEEIGRYLYQLYNATKFFNDSMTKFVKDGYTFDINSYKHSTNIMDKWIISKFNGLLNTIQTNMKAYHIYKIKDLLFNFMEDLSNWYLRLTRDRMKAKNEDINDKSIAFSVSYYIMFNFVKCLAPFSPFYSEFLYQKLKYLNSDDTLSVHLCDYPEVNEMYINKDIETQVSQMKIVPTIVKELRMKSEKARSTKVPLKQVMVVCEDDMIIENIKMMEEYLIKEINCISIIYKKIHCKNNYKIVINHKELGIKYRKSANIIREKLQGYDTSLIKSENDILVIDIDGGVYEITSPCIELKKEEVLICNEFEKGMNTNGINIIVDFEYTEDIKKMYFKRMFTYTIQKMRKIAGLNTWDKIKVYYEVGNNDTIKELIEDIKVDVESEILYNIYKKEEEIKEFIKCDNLNFEGSDVGITIIKD
jgi:isoleucyl-tRNA synthetase